MRFSTTADPSAVVASAAAAEKRQRKERDTAVAAAAAKQAAADSGAAAGGDAAVANGILKPQKQEAAPVPEALAGLPPTLGRFMAAQGFTAPTAIQDR